MTVTPMRLDGTEGDPADFEPKSSTRWYCVTATNTRDIVFFVAAESDEDATLAGEELVGAIDWSDYDPDIDSYVDTRTTFDAVPGGCEFWNGDEKTGHWDVAPRDGA